MVHPIFFPRVLTALLLLAASSGCGTDRDAPAGATGAVTVRQAAPDQAREASGLSHLPKPKSPETFGRILARHYPERYVGVRPSTSVLVDVSLDEHGIVKDVAVVDRPPVVTSNAVLVDRKAGSSDEVLRAVRPTVYDNAFGAAATAALKEVRFHPARRDGQPVPFTFRMTVEFTSPTS